MINILIKKIEVADSEVSKCYQMHLEKSTFVIHWILFPLED